MERLSKYLLFNGGDSSNNLKNISKEILSIEDITEQSTPSEISKFVSKKLAQFINIELESNKVSIQINSNCCNNYYFYFLRQG